MGCNHLVALQHTPDELLESVISVWHSDKLLQELDNDQPIEEDRHRTVEREILPASCSTLERQPHGCRVLLLAPRLELALLPLRILAARMKLVEDGTDQVTE